MAADAHYMESLLADGESVPTPPTELAGAVVGAGGPRLNIRLEYGNIVGAHFLSRMLAEGLAIVRGDGWNTTADADAIPAVVVPA
jgi:hypothetical protein